MTLLPTAPVESIVPHMLTEACSGANDAVIFARRRCCQQCSHQSLERRHRRRFSLLRPRAAI